MNQTSDAAVSKMSKIWHYIRFDFEVLWLIITRPQETLQYSRLSELFRGKKLFPHFVLPLSVIASIANIVGMPLGFQDTSFETEIIKSIFTFITYTLTYYVLKGFIHWFTAYGFNDKVHHWQTESLTAVILGVTFAVKMLMGLFPSLFFIQFFYVYTFYIVWQCSDTLVPINENQKNRYMVIVTLFSFAMPVAVNFLLRLLVPNI